MVSRKGTEINLKVERQVRHPHGWRYLKLTLYHRNDIM